MESSGPSARLTREQRAALDPRVDPARLEAFLARIPLAARRFALNACLGEPDPEIPGIVGSINRELEAAWRDVWRRAEHGLPGS